MISKKIQALIYMNEKLTITLEHPVSSSQIWIVAYLGVKD